MTREKKKDTSRDKAANPFFAVLMKSTVMPNAGSLLQMPGTPSAPPGVYW